jgi:hypothetical protein
MKEQCKYLDPISEECSYISGGSDGMVICNHYYEQFKCKDYKKEKHDRKKGKKVLD